MDLSICICAMDNRAFLETCLGSLRHALAGLVAEVIVVDNGSTDGSIDMLAKHYPEVRVIANAANRGVAPARNQALQAARGRYLLLLDADTEFIDFDMPALLRFMDAHTNVGLLGVRQLTFNDAPYDAARTFPRPRDIVLRRLSFLPMARNSAAYEAHHQVSRATAPVEVDYVIGAFQLIPRAAWEQAGPLDEKMFYGFEDADYCARIRKAGWQVIYHPGFVIRHYVQGMTRRKMLNKRRLKLLAYHLRSYLRFHRKHRDLLG
jgi:hypothetical protein